uniref:Kunitz 2 n=1 Tax=Eublepharis macularius TaxID=481883 RepID=A0A098LWM5_EUBMA
MGGGTRATARGRAGPLLLLLALAAALAAGSATGAPRGDCLLPCVIGRCRAAFPRWWYNATSQVCQEFMFGGCRGNANNFLSEKECLQTCAAGGEEEMTGIPLTSQSGTEAVSTTSHRHQQAEDTARFQEYCAAPPVTGRCRASFPRWFFSTETRTCKMFIYGGCGGNRNNYLLEEDCLSQCVRDMELPGESEEVPNTHGRIFPDSAVHSTRAVVLAVLLALMLASLLLVVVKICHKSRELSQAAVWSTMDDKEFLMRDSHTL